jgi:hypothetical protein
VHMVKMCTFGLFSVVCFLLGNSPASEFYMPTFRNTLFHLHRQVGVRSVAVGSNVCRLCGLTGELETIC